MSTDLKYEKINIELRRGKVLELLARGHSQSDIAKKLNVSNALISRRSIPKGASAARVKSAY